MVEDWSADRTTELQGVLDRAVDAGQAVALQNFRSDISVDYKESSMDPVTHADTEVQTAIIEVLEASQFDATVIAEEDDTDKTIPAEGAAWIIDPIDGTNNFIRGNRLWTISIAYLEDGTPLASVTALPASGDRYRSIGDAVQRNETIETVSDRTDLETFIGTPIFGLKRRHRDEYEHVSFQLLEYFGDIRRLGSGQATLAAVACGEVEAALSTVPLSPWDTIAGVHLVRQAGGTVTDLAGNPWTHEADSVIASNGTCHKDILEILQD